MSVEKEKKVIEIVVIINSILKLLFNFFKSKKNGKN